MYAEHGIEHRGFRFRYRLHDNAKQDWVVILGGALQSLNSWNRYADGYVTRFNVAICDLPGMGESDVLPNQYPIEFLADCLKRIVDTERMGAIFLHAVSYATPIAYQFSVKYPESASRVILAATMREMSDHIREKTEYSIELIERGQLDQASELFGRMFMACDQLDLHSACRRCNF